MENSAVDTPQEVSLPEAATLSLIATAVRVPPWGGGGEALIFYEAARDWPDCCAATASRGRLMKSRP
jgi:hypothetical protein